MGRPFDPLAPASGTSGLEQNLGYQQAVRDWLDDSPESLARFRAELDDSFRNCTHDRKETRK